MKGIFKFDNSPETILRPISLEFFIFILLPNIFGEISSYLEEEKCVTICTIS